jgi:hypothetical protein
VAEDIVTLGSLELGLKNGKVLEMEFVARMVFESPGGESPKIKAMQVGR